MKYLFERKNGKPNLVKRIWYRLWKKRYDVNTNGKLQLIKSRCYGLLKKRLDVHLNYNSWEKLIMTAQDKVGSANNEFSTPIEAGQINSILKYLGITEKILRNARLPKDAKPEMADDLEGILDWLSKWNKKQTTMRSRSNYETKKLF